jgi:chromosome segregation ATPase
MNTSVVQSADKQNTDNEKKQLAAIQEIYAFTFEFCGQTPARGGENQIEVAGKLGVGFNNLIKKLVDLEIEGAAKYKQKEWQGILQRDLASVRIQEIDCRKVLAEKLVDKLVFTKTETQLSIIRKEISISSNNLASYYEEKATINQKISEANSTIDELSDKQAKMSAMLRPLSNEENELRRKIRICHLEIERNEKLRKRYHENGELTKDRSRRLNLEDIKNKENSRKYRDNLEEIMKQIDSIEYKIGNMGRKMRWLSRRRIPDYKNRLRQLDQLIKKEEQKIARLKDAIDNL